MNEKNKKVGPGGISTSFYCIFGTAFSKKAYSNPRPQVPLFHRWYWF